MAVNRLKVMNLACSLLSGNKVLNGLFYIKSKFGMAVVCADRSNMCYLIEHVMFYLRIEKGQQIYQMECISSNVNKQLSYGNLMNNAFPPA